MTLWWRPFTRTRTLPLGELCMAGVDTSGLLGTTTQRCTTTYTRSGWRITRTTVCSDLNYYYDWGIGQLNEPANRARMFWGLGDEWGNQPYEDHKTWTGTVAAEDCRRAYKRDWLIGNECDCDYGQCGSGEIGGGPTTVSDVPAGAEAAAVRYHEVYQAITTADPGARVFAGGCLQIGLQSTKDWWDAFLTRLDTGADGVSWLSEANNQHVHMYPCLSTGHSIPGQWPAAGEWRIASAVLAAENWYSNQHVGAGLTGAIWITETGPFAYNEQLKAYSKASAWDKVLDNAMIPIKEWFLGQSDYGRIYWYKAEDNGDDWPNTLVYNGELTPLGTEWIS